jgi:hypothetical protein
MTNLAVADRLKSYGHLVYDGSKCIVSINNDFSRFYRSLLPKSLKFNTTRYPSHITVVRGGVETVDSNLWGYSSGERIEFEYDPYIHIGYRYIFLDVFSDHLKEIRKHLGLTELRSHPIYGNYSCFHITIANTKELSN